MDSIRPVLPVFRKRRSDYYLGGRLKWLKTPIFRPKKTMNGCQTLWFFGENELLEVRDNLDDDEISLFVEENRNLYATELRRQNLLQSFNVNDLRCLLKWSSLPE